MTPKPTTNTRHPEYYEHLQNLVDRLKNASPGVMTGFDQLHRQAVGPGALAPKVKQLIALAIAIALRCDGCVTYHVKDALSAGANRNEILEAIGTAILMGGAPCVVYGAEALEAVRQFESASREDSRNAPGSPPGS